jgi:hypothetical protein
MKNEWHGGKGPDSRISDVRAYWDCPLWENMKKKKYDSYSEFSSDLNKVLDDRMEGFENINEDEYKPFRALFLDDQRDPENAWIHDENKKLQQVSGIANYKWDVVRTYEEFVEYVEKYRLPRSRYIK